jgi:hypothetical protein
LYKHRFHTILQKLKLRLIEEPGVTIVAYIRNPAALEQVLVQYSYQTWKNKELILLTSDHDHFKVWEKELLLDSTISIHLMDQEKPLGHCVSHAINQAQYEFISLFNESHYYAPNFIIDLMHAFHYTDAHIVGKGTYYVYEENEANLYLRYEGYNNKYVKRLTDSAWIMKKEVFAKAAFPNKLGIGFNRFLDQCMQAGLKLYSTDKYNYVLIKERSGNEPEPGALITQSNDYKKIVLL